MAVDAPTAVIPQRVLAHSHRFHVRQKLEQRVGGPRYQDLIAGIGQQLEQVGVSFTRAGREKDAVHGHRVAAFCIVGTDGFAGGGDSGGRRFISQHRGVVKRMEDFRRIVQARMSRVGFGEIENPHPGGTLGSEGASQVVYGELPVKAGGKHVSPDCSGPRAGSTASES